jgi:thioredoxin-related protein
MTTTLPPRDLARIALGFLVLASFAHTASAGESVQWRADYNEARRESAEKGKPMLIDFVTEDCMYCRKLDATTFRDPAIVSLLNERFVCLKIDAGRETTLSQALRITAYPTMILGASDGKIVTMIEGYMEAGRLGEHLQRALTTATTPDWMARDFQEATKAIAAGDYSRAVSMLKAIGEDGKDKPVQVKARKVLDELEQQAATVLARAKQMEDRGQPLEAADQLSDLLKNYAGTQAAKDGAAALTALAAKPELRDKQRTLRARELLASARSDYRSQQYLACLERCETLSATYGDLPEGNEGSQLASEIKSNPDLMKRACDSMEDRLAGMYLAMADSWMKKGDKAQAQECLERLVQACPKSAQAQSAQTRLAQIQGRPTQQAEFKKP